jgi:hypothetical protein
MTNDEQRLKRLERQRERLLKITNLPPLPTSASTAQVIERLNSLIAAIKEG